MTISATFFGSDMGSTQRFVFASGASSDPHCVIEPYSSGCCLHFRHNTLRAGQSGIRGQHAVVACVGCSRAGDGGVASGALDLTG